MLVHIINNLKIGGAQKLIVDLSIGLSENLNSLIVVFNSETNKNYIKKLKENNVKIICFWRSPLYVLKKIFQCNLVLVHLFPAMYLIPILRLLNKKVMFVEHSTNSRRRNLLLFKLIDNFVYSKCVKIICVSDLVKESLKAYYKFSFTQIVVIKNGVNLRHINSFYYNKKSKSKGTVIGTLGRLSEEKNYIGLIKACSLLKSNYILKVGGDGQLLDDLKRLVKQLNLERKIFFVGEVINVDQFFRELDFYVQPSLWEGFGLTVVESQMYNLPICLSNIPAFLEFKFHKRQYFNAMCHKNISNVMDRMISNPHLFQLSNKNLNKFLHENDVKNTLKKYKDLYYEK